MFSSVADNAWVLVVVVVVADCSIWSVLTSEIKSLQDNDRTSAVFKDVVLLVLLLVYWSKATDFWPYTSRLPAVLDWVVGVAAVVAVVVVVVVAVAVVAGLMGW